MPNNSNLILILISSQELESLLQNEFMKAKPSELSQTNLRLIEGTMMIRSYLLERLSRIGKEDIKVCDVRVDQKSKLETFRGLLEDLLLRLVSNGSNQISQLRWKVLELNWSHHKPYTYLYWLMTGLSPRTSWVSEKRSVLR